MGFQNISEIFLKNVICNIKFIKLSLNHFLNFNELDLLH